MPSVLWHCWFHIRKSIRPVKIEWWGNGDDVVICLQQGADCLHMVQLMLLSSQNPIISCLIWIHTDFTFLVPAYPHCPGKEAHTPAHTHPFNGSLSRTTRVSRYQKGKTNLDFTEARDSEWQWNPLGHTQVCTSLQTDNHTSTPPLSFLQAGCPSCFPTNSAKALKATFPELSRFFTFKPVAICRLGFFWKWEVLTFL